MRRLVQQVKCLNRHLNRGPKPLLVGVGQAEQGPVGLKLRTCWRLAMDFLVGFNDGWHLREVGIADDFTLLIELAEGHQPLSPSRPRRWGERPMHRRR